MADPKMGPHSLLILGAILSLATTACDYAPAGQSTATAQETTTTVVTSTVVASTSTVAPSSTTQAPNTTSASTTTTTSRGAEFIGTVYSPQPGMNIIPQQHGVDLRRLGGGLITWPEYIPDPVHAVSRWVDDETQLLWFEVEVGEDQGAGPTWKVLDVVSISDPHADVASSGCIAGPEGMDPELFGFVELVGDEWRLTIMWRANRSLGRWERVEVANHTVLLATGGCELGAGDGGLP
ncbi:MAG: hypothetical protein ACRDU9_06740 [Acidimicrobiia bacterium]